MKIAIVSTSCLRVPPRTYGGTELVVYELVEGLRERGHEVTLYATGDSLTSAELCSLYPEAQWPPDFYADLNHATWALEEARRRGFDLIHAHGVGALAAMRLLPGMPLVYTLHHVRDEGLSAFYRYFPEPWYVAISADQARREEPQQRLAVIHHGLDPARYTWAESSGDYVCFLGRFTQVKGPHTAIDVAGRAGVTIRMAGEVHPIDREFADREVMPRLARPHVHYVGCVGPEEKQVLLRDARAILIPIEWNEPFGLTIIEAMLSGCPVVAFPRGSVPELVEPGVTGFLTRSAAEMAELIRPGGPLEGFDRRRCRERAIERFSRARMVADHERLYARVLAGSQDDAAPPSAAAVAGA